MKRLIIFSLFLCVLPVLANEPDDSNVVVFSEDRFNVRLDTESPVAFFGKVDVNGSSGGAGAMMYPGGSAAVFLASIVVHAAVAGSVERKHLSAEQMEANKVLLDYQSYIDKIDASFIQVDDLAIAPERVARLFFESEFDLSSRWAIQSRPVFFMTPNQKTLILYSQFTFEDLSLPKPKQTRKSLKNNSHGKSKKTDPNKKIVVIVSDHLDDSNAREYWLREKGKNFNMTVKSLYQESLLLALRNHTGYFSSQNSKQVTVRYLEDGEKKIERGSIISQTCERTLFETLSGEIKSVPNMNSSECLSDINVQVKTLAIH